MASLKAQDYGNAYAERLAWESGNRFANSIRPFNESLGKVLQKRLNAGESLSYCRLNKHNLINTL
jgi:hypothetical protein